MDEDLIRRHREGDPSARTAVRNHLRGVAARMLSAPQWDLPEPRAAAEVEAVEAAMAGRATTPAALAADTLAAAAALALSVVDARELLPAEGHLDVSMAVSLGMERASANQVALAEGHLAACPTCARRVERVRQALKSAAAAAAPAPAPVVFTSPEATTVRRPAPSPPRAPPPRRTAPDRGPLLRLALTVAVLVAFGAWTSRPDPEARALAAAAMLPPELPPAGRAPLYEPRVRDALLRMAQKGECRAAIPTLARAWEADPGDLYLRWYEGLARVCVRDGAGAVAALREVEASLKPPPFGMDWWMAQALLLDGQHDAALQRLDRLASSEHPRAGAARALADRAREAR